MLILEGPDCVGKTTAAKKLAAMADVDLRHMSRPDPDFDHSYTPDRVIQDRFHLGEIVYGRMLMGGGPYTWHEHMRMIQAYLRWQGCFVVIMYAEREWLRKQLGGRDEMYSVDQILAANDAYKMLAHSTNHGEPYCDVAFDVTDGWPDDDTLKNWLDSWRF